MALSLYIAQVVTDAAGNLTYLRCLITFEFLSSALEYCRAYIFIILHFVLALKNLILLHQHGRRPKFEEKLGKYIVILQHRSAIEHALTLNLTAPSPTQQSTASMGGRKKGARGAQAHRSDDEGARRRETNARITAASGIRRWKKTYG